MHKLIMRLQIILIGLNLAFFLGCVLTEIDPPKKRAVVKFQNSSNKNVQVRMLNHPLSGNGLPIVIQVMPKDNAGNNEFVYDINAIQDYFSIVDDAENVAIEVYVEDMLVKSWIGPSGAFGDDLNTPFNYDSWVFESISATGNNVVGRIIFTITSEDIGN